MGTKNKVKTRHSRGWKGLQIIHENDMKKRYDRVDDAEIHFDREELSGSEIEEVMAKVNHGLLQRV